MRMCSALRDGVAPGSGGFGSNVPGDFCKRGNVFAIDAAGLDGGDGFFGVRAVLIGGGEEACRRRRKRARLFEGAAQDGAGFEAGSENRAVTAFDAFHECGGDDHAGAQAGAGIARASRPGLCTRRR